ncbi:MAG: tRNA 2-thiouridine(34) synthase MnmA [Gammaproteobacteria bacterium]|nr:MAG: tRNA 2-thiouridine(34) synthase MnmA [Gammaproteobacteria bacterium]
MTAVRHKIFVGLSGGVDSAVAALCLRAQGHAVVGVFMKNWEEDDRDGHCAAAEDLAAARAVAEHLDIPLLTVNFSSEYWERVFEHFLAEYRAGRTPNPDVLCNSEIKFRAFLDFARERGATAIATGHYARIERVEEGHRLCLSADPDKDQTYFLHRLTQEQLAAARFPLGGFTKRRVRARARAAGLPNAQRRDSTGICFIGERRFRDFLARYLPAMPGAMVTPEGRTVGEHRGLMFYTIGQRQGLGIGGGGNGRPWYVADKDLERNRLIVVQGADHPLLYHEALELESLHWITGTPPAAPLRCLARLRHRQPLQPCTLYRSKGHWRLRFDRPQRAIAPGQSAVVYLDGVCLGGGVIRRALRVPDAAEENRAHGG